jgi:hypothetical protein
LLYQVQSEPEPEQVQVLVVVVVVVEEGGYTSSVLPDLHTPMIILL